MTARARGRGRRAAGRRRRRLALAAAMIVVGGLVWWLAAQDGPEAVAVSEERPAAAETLLLEARVVADYPHDPEASTQGLLWFEGRLFESTGLWGRSSVRRVDLADGRVEQKVELEPTLFGEGLARIGRELVQLTWQSGRALRWDLDTLAALGEHAYEGEGWGLCFDGEHLWRSDGSARLFRHDPTDFRVLDWLEVRRVGAPVALLNELECAEGWIYANVLQRDEIVRIDSASGRVVAVIDIAGLAGPAERAAGVANGIAYRAESQTFLLTGKGWPRLFEVVFASRTLS